MKFQNRQNSPRAEKIRTVNPLVVRWGQGLNGRELSGMMEPFIYLDRDLGFIEISLVKSQRMHISCQYTSLYVTFTPKEKNYKPILNSN